MGFVLGRLFAVVAVVAGAVGCERRHPAVIGVVFGEEQHPNVLDVVRDELRRRYPDAPPEIRSPRTQQVEEGAPGAVTVATAFTKVPGLVAVVRHVDLPASLFPPPR